MRRPGNTLKTACKLCGSTNLVKYGSYRGIQRWWCKDCRHKFADNEAIAAMKTPAEQVASAIDMYFAGVHLHHIPGLLFKRYGAFISYTAVYHWIVHFCQLAIEETEKNQLKVGDVWMISESSSRNDIKDVRLSFLDVIDISTAFLLATRMVYNRSQYDVKALIEQAGTRAGKMPSKILTDGWKGYTHGIGLAQGGRAAEIQVLEFEDSGLPEIFRCWQNAAARRAKIINGLKKESTALLMLQGWNIHYNYFTANEALAGHTPAAAAAADSRYNNWFEIVRQARI
jgi:transposase-like protein